MRTNFLRIIILSWSILIFIYFGYNVLLNQVADDISRSFGTGLIVASLVIFVEFIISWADIFSYVVSRDE